MTKRLLEIKIKGFADPMLLCHVEGEMALGSAFVFYLTVSTPTAFNHLHHLLGRSTTFTINTGDQCVTYNGLIEAVCDDGTPALGWWRYQLTVRPWLYCLNDARHCRIFQKLTVPEIVVRVFKSHQCNQYDLTQLSRNYPQLDYCVQYNETDFDFVNRLLQAAGIYYTFKHNAQQHVCVLTDRGFADEYYPHRLTLNTTHSDDGIIKHWQETCELRPNKISRGEFDFTRNPMVNTLSAQQADSINACGRHESVLEVYSYPCEWPYLGDVAGAQFVARLLQTQPSTQVHAHSLIPAFRPGLGFEIETIRDQRPSRRFMLTRVQISAHDETGLSAHLDTQPQPPYFHNDFAAIAHEHRFVPQLTTPKPKIDNLQTAMVVGPDNETVYTDRYGRIKVQFHWDHLAQLNATRSCWIRCAQLWAGDGYGTLFIPRIGQEVLVDFEEGDPDRPFVVGAVFNRDHLPPFTPATTSAQSGIRTQNLNEDDHSHGNVLKFDDQPINPQVLIKAQKDFNVSAEGDSSLQVGGDYLEVLTQDDYRHHCTGNLRFYAAKAIVLCCGNSCIRIDHDQVRIEADEVMMTNTVSQN